MLGDEDLGLGWFITETGGPSRCRADDLHPFAVATRDIEERERRLGIPPGMPIIASPEGVDYRVTQYFRFGFSGGQQSTSMTYARELLTWVKFLDPRGARWDEAGRDDVRAFQVWRVYDEGNHGRVSPATWNKGWAALNHFYSWMKANGWIDASPVAPQDRLKDPYSVSAGGHREKNARASRDRWVTPSEFRMWRDVGLRGYGAITEPSGRVVAGLPDDSARMRNTARNWAFVDWLIVTGLRESEAGTLLANEVPSLVGERVPIIGKGKVLRHYEAVYRMGPESMHGYLIGERRDAIRRAQRVGRYDAIDGRLEAVAVEKSGRRGRRIRLSDGSVQDVVGLTAATRARLFVEGPSGLEPAWLWLTDAGMPMQPQTWNKVFEAANARVTRARAGLGLRSSWVHVTPHSLRYSFALMMLIAGVRAIDAERGFGGADPFFEFNYDAVFDDVRDLLGHASVETTKRTYLEPVKALRRASVIRGGSVGEMFDSLAKSSPLVGFGGHQ